MKWIVITSKHPMNGQEKRMAINVESIVSIMEKVDDGRAEIFYEGEYWVVSESDFDSLMIELGKRGNGRVIRLKNFKPKRPSNKGRRLKHLTVVK